VAEPLRDARFSRDAVVVGGCGHVGLPLAIALAARGATVGVYDTNARAVVAVGSGRMPFAEPGAQAPLRRALATGSLTATTDPAVVGTAEHVILVTGEPPDAALARVAAQLRPGQLLVLRGTVNPGGTARAEKLCADLGLDCDVAYCPERIAEGRAMSELFELPQLVGSRSQGGLDRAAQLFRLITPAVVSMSPEEAELAKLYANAWRYVSFAVANQFYAIANDQGLDYERIRQFTSAGYERCAELPRAGFAAGPCLPKDTRALADAHPAFSLGPAAIAANEGLAGYLAARLDQRYGLAGMCVGILGMAFKAGSDDTRQSLSYRLKQLIEARGARVLCTDSMVRDDQDLLPLQEVVARADLLVVATPQPAYRDLSTDKPVADIWGVTGTGVRT
jgi:UDP-N-acetyl-D-mannosaminuronic acid dehydrogenase